MGYSKWVRCSVANTTILIVTPLEDLGGASLALAKKPIPPATAAYIPATVPALPTGGIKGRVARVRLWIGTPHAASKCRPDDGDHGDVPSQDRNGGCLECGRRH